MRTFMLVLALGLVAVPPLHAGRPSQAEALAWLETKTGAPELNINGEWESTTSYFQGGWGNGSFAQTGGKLIGTLGPYSVEGRIAGKQIFLVILSNAKVYYTAILEVNKEGGIVGTAIGKALADGPDVLTNERAPVLLVRRK